MLASARAMTGPNMHVKMPRKRGSPREWTRCSRRSTSRRRSTAGALGQRGPEHRGARSAAPARQHQRLGGDGQALRRRRGRLRGLRRLGHVVGDGLRRDRLRGRRRDRLRGRRRLERVEVDGRVLRGRPRPRARARAAAAGTRRSRRRCRASSTASRPSTRPSTPGTRRRRRATRSRRSRTSTRSSTAGTRRRRRARATRSPTPTATSRPSAAATSRL